MGKYLIGSPVRLSFPDGEFVDLKPELSQEDSDYIMSRMVNVKGGKYEVNIELGRLPTMERMIVAWSFKDKEPLPVNRENISNLQGKYRALILNKIDELNREANSFLTG